MSQGKTQTQTQTADAGTKIVQLTRNIDGHLFGQTFTEENAKALGFEPGDYREFASEADDKADAASSTQ